MFGDLIINNKDAYLVFGATMGDGFIDTLLTNAPMKEYIKNSSRLNAGSSITNSNPVVDERNLSLMFDIEGSSTSDYLAKLKLFYAEMNKGLVTIKVPPLGPDIYKLYYLKPGSCNGNVHKSASRITLQFTEPNPTDRT